MKQTRTKTIALAACLALTTAPAFAVDYVINTFNDSASVTSANDGGTGGGCSKAIVPTWDGAVNAPTGPAGGSLYVQTCYDPLIGAWQDSKVNFGIPEGTIDGANYLSLDYDIKVDVANSVTGTNGTYGGVQSIAQNWGGLPGGWVTLASTTLTNGDWVHVSAPLVSFPYPIYNIVINQYSNGFGDPRGCVAVWIDNVVLKSPSPDLRPNMSIMRPPSAGYTSVASQFNGQWQRQMIRAGSDLNADPYFSFIKDFYAMSNVVTYSFTITNFPSPVYGGDSGAAGFVVQMFLVPKYLMGDTSSTNLGAGGWSDTAVDWNAGFVQYLTMGYDTNGLVLIDYRLKTNSWGGQDMIYADGNMGHWTNTAILGTWSLQFSNNIYVTLYGPGGFVSPIVTLPYDWALYWADPMTFFIGTQPNDVNRVGQYATLNRVRVLGANTALDDNFVNSSNTFNLDVWGKVAADPNGVFVTPGDSKYWLKWTTPDAGYAAVWACDKITRTRTLASSNWLPIIPASNWVTIGDMHMANVRLANLTNTFGYNPTNVFFSHWRTFTP